MWSGDLPGGLEVVRGPIRRSGSSRGTFPEVWKRSGDLPEGFKSGQWTHTKVRKWSGYPP